MGQFGENPKQNVKDTGREYFDLEAGKILIDGSPIEVTLAKPVDKDSYIRYTRGTGGRGGSVQGEYAYTIGHVYDPATAYLGAPVFYAPSPAYTAAIPSIHFPTAKGYVSNRGLLRPPSVREIYMSVPVGAAGVRGLGGRGYLAYTGLGRGCAGYQVKIDKRGDEKLYDILPGMELTPMSTVALKPQGIKPASQVLEEICQKNNWGPASLSAPFCHWVKTSDNCFLYKITIPLLATQNPTM
ncbi:APOBEC1 complementation factor-like [Bombina bombina]|uniref:APOBEC1 complementation factor-like n=1 Tax=Bombina bombina TaxID=8345 RepID=UPI00235A7FFC|nr:APOBEC1 complementation factor-like [Bombina bombina]